jgi:hypothetical protein
MLNNLHYRLCFHLGGHSFAMVAVLVSNNRFHFRFRCCQLGDHKKNLVVVAVVLVARNHFHFHCLHDLKMKIF